MFNPSVSLILPAYNEVKRIAQTIGEVRDYFVARETSYEIIVSADGDDGTFELVAEMARSDTALRAFGNRERLGKGRGIRDGVLLATGQIIGFADADNKVPINEYDKIEPWLSEGYEVVIGGRGFSESRIEKPQPWYRWLGSRVFGFYMHTLIGLPEITDTQCGFKFFQAPIAKSLFSHQKIDGYMFDVEILYLAMQFGYRIREVPIRWSDDRDSRLNLVAGNVRNFLDILRIRQLHKEPALGLSRVHERSVSGKP